jgi:tetratricopeptide (TPR) repeat protein
MLATFGMRAPRDVYSQFLEAHERAVEVGGLRPELRCNKAHGLHMFERRYDAAEAEFQAALREKPSYATALVRSALLYSTLGRLDEAMAVLDRAYQVEPLLPTLPATVVNVRIWRREFDEAVDVGRNAVELHPYLQISRVNYALALECSGDFDEALEQYQLGSVMSPNLPWMRALEATCLAKMGRGDDARRVLRELESLRTSEYVDAYHMAVLRDALGERDDAIVELKRACDENSAFLYAIDIDPKVDRLRSDARFARVRKQLNVDSSREQRQI